MKVPESSRSWFTALAVLLLFVNVASAYSLCCLEMPADSAHGEKPCHTAEDGQFNPLDSFDDCSLCVTAATVSDVSNDAPVAIPAPPPAVFSGEIAGGLDPPYRPPTESLS